MAVRAMDPARAVGAVLSAAARRSIWHTRKCRTRAAERSRPSCLLPRRATYALRDENPGLYDAPVIDSNGQPKQRPNTSWTYLDVFALARQSCPNALS